MHSVCRFNVLLNAIIDWISVSVDTVPKNIRLADKVYNFGWNLAEPQKFWRRCGAALAIKFRRGGMWRPRWQCDTSLLQCLISLQLVSTPLQFIQTVNNRMSAVLSRSKET